MIQDPSIKSVDEIIAYFDTDAQYGLSRDQVGASKRIYGANVLPKKKQPALIFLFIRQFMSPLVYILVGAAVIMFFIGNQRDALVVSVILIFNAMIATIQEGRMQSILEALKRFLTTKVLVIREGKTNIIREQELVPGDIIILKEGERIVADARLIEAHELKIDQSSLTGESNPALKDAKILAKKLPLMDQSNMVFSGTYVLAGYGKAVVVATGQRTEIGKIGKEIEQIEPVLPLKKEIDALARAILYIIIVLCVFLFFIGFLYGKNITDLFLILTALFICVIPEGLPVVLTLTLVRGAHKMAQSNVLVRRLQAAEGLGRVDVIVIDKTGTLTRNEMMVTALVADDKLYTVSGDGYNPTGNITIDHHQVNYQDDVFLEKMLHAAALLTHAEIQIKDNKIYEVRGDPTDAAMMVLAQKVGLNRQQLTNYTLIEEIPFDTKTRYQSGIYRIGELIEGFIIGAPEVLIEKAGGIEKRQEELLAKKLKEGYRIIAVGYKKQKVPDHISGVDFFDKNIEFLGFFAIQDALRMEVKKSIVSAKHAGLKIIMATGDHAQTALFIAKTVGIFSQHDKHIDGADLDQYTDEALLKIIDIVTVYSRVEPLQKLRIIRLLQKKKYLVAMTGDGVNDAPSLMAADIGISMGKIGTEIAKESADMILVDDQFSSILQAVRQGRHMIETLRRVLLYFFTTNFAEILLILIALLLNLSLPLTAVQILWLNLITDGFLDVALAMEPCVHMHIARPPKTLIDVNILMKMVISALPMAVISLIVFYYHQANLIFAQTLALMTMSMFQWMNAWNCRSEYLPIVSIGIFSNIWLLLATGTVIALQIALVNVSFMQHLFHVTKIDAYHWFLILVITLPLFIGGEFYKVFKRRFYAGSV